MLAPTPKNVAARFQRRITDLTRDFDELILAVHQKRRQASLEAMIAEQTTLLSAVLWEAFISDLIVAYVLRNPASCLGESRKRLKQSLAVKFGGIARWVAFTPPKTVNLAQAEK